MEADAGTQLAYAARLAVGLLVGAVIGPVREFHREGFSVRGL